MKKTINLSTWLLAFSLIGALTITSCQKENSLVNSAPVENDPVELAATQDATVQEAESEAQFDDVFNITASMNTSQVGEDLGLRDRKSTRLNSSHVLRSRMPSSA